MKKIITLLLLISANVFCSAEDKKLKLPVNKEKFHVFFLMGQSNMAGYGKITEDDKKPTAGILQLPTLYKGKLDWSAGVHPLNNRLPSHRFGLGLPFAKQYLKDNPGVTIGLIPVAWGGAPINRLNKGGAVYKDVLLKAAFAQQQGVIKGILWHQGESDSVRVNLTSSYEAKLHKLVNDLRQDFKLPKLPFIAGNLAEFYGIGRKGTHGQGIPKIKKILRDLPSKVKYCAFVESTGLKSIDHHNVHFDRQSYITFGQRYAEALKNLKK